MPEFHSRLKPWDLLTVGGLSVNCGVQVMHVRAGSRLRHTPL